MELGFYFEMKLNAGENWMNSSMRHLWKSAHLHGNLFGILNILLGILVQNFRLNGKLTQIASWFAFCGGILFPTALFLGGINFKFVYIAPFGGLCMIAGWILLVLQMIKINYKRL